MSKDLKFTLRFDAENKQFIGQVRGADNAVASLGNQSATTGRQMRTMNHQSDALEGQMFSLRNQLLGVAAGFSAVAAAQKATDRPGALLNEAGQDRLVQMQQQVPQNNRDIEAFYAESDEINGAWLMRLAMQADMENQAKIREEYAFDDRLARLSQSFQSAYAQAQENQQLQDELEREYFANREILRADHEANLTDIDKQATDERAAYQAQVAESTLTFTQQQLSITTNFLKQAGEEQGGFYRVLFAAQKLAAIPSMIMATEEAATKALSFGPPPVGMALSTAVRTMGYASVGIVAGQALAGQAHDGINRVPAQNEGTWMLRKDEMVLNPAQADNFRWMVTAMQQMKTMQSQQQQAMQYGGSPNVNVAAPPVHVAFLDNQQQLKAYLRSDSGEQAVVKIVQRNKASF